MPPRLLKTSVTYLQLARAAAQPSASAAVPPAGVEVQREPDIPLERYRYLYDAVGRSHHWTSRHLPDWRLKEEIHAAGVQIYVMTADGEPAGWFELDTAHAPGQTRIVHFAVLPAFRGHGYGTFLIDQAIAAALASDCTTVVLETNTLDHPAALPLYRSRGFQPVGTRTVLTPAIGDPS